MSIVGTHLHLGFIAMQNIGSLQLQLTRSLPKTSLTNVIILCSIGLNSSGNILNVHQIGIFNPWMHFGLNMDMRFCRLPPPTISCVGLSLVAFWFLQVMRAKIHISTTCVHSIVDCFNLNKFLWLRKTHGGNIPQEKLKMV
jgi:hypothetical protein